LTQVAGYSLPSFAGLAFAVPLISSFALDGVASVAPRTGPDSHQNPNQQQPNQRMPNQHLPNQHLPNQHLPNQRECGWPWA
jgi:hypothetical protein